MPLATPAVAAPVAKNRSEGSSNGVAACAVPTKFAPQVGLELFFKIGGKQLGEDDSLSSDF